MHPLDRLRQPELLEPGQHRRHVVGRHVLVEPEPGPRVVGPAAARQEDREGAVLLGVGVRARRLVVVALQPGQQIVVHRRHPRGRGARAAQWFCAGACHHGSPPAIVAGLGGSTMSLLSMCLSRGLPAALLGALAVTWAVTWAPVSGAPAEPSTQRAGSNPLAGRPVGHLCRRRRRGLGGVGGAARRRGEDAAGADRPPAQVEVVRPVGPPRPRAGVGRGQHRRRPERQPGDGRAADRLPHGPVGGDGRAPASRRPPSRPTTRPGSTSSRPGSVIAHAAIVLQPDGPFALCARTARSSTPS